MSLSKKNMDKIEGLIDVKEIAAQLKLSMASDKAVFDEQIKANTELNKTIDTYVKYSAIKNEELKNNAVFNKKYNNTAGERQVALEALNAALEMESIRNDAMQKTLVFTMGMTKMLPLTHMSDNVIYLQKKTSDTQKRAQNRNELVDIISPIYDKIFNKFADSTDLNKMLKGCGALTFFAGTFTGCIYWIVVLVGAAKTFGQMKKVKILECFGRKLENRIFENYLVPRSNNIGKLIAHRAELSAKKFGAEYDLDTLKTMCDTFSAFLPEEFRDFEAIDDIISLFKSGRCDTLKEAYALEDGRAAARKREEADEKAREQIQKSQARVEELAYQKAIEAEKQTEYLKQAADSAKKAANYASEQAQAASRAADSQKKAAEEAGKLRDDLEYIRRNNL